MRKFIFILLMCICSITNAQELSHNDFGKLIVNELINSNDRLIIEKTIKNADAFSCILQAKYLTESSAISIVRRSMNKYKDIILLDNFERKESDKSWIGSTYYIQYNDITYIIGISCKETVENGYILVTVIPYIIDKKEI